MTASSPEPELEGEAERFAAALIAHDREAAGRTVSRLRRAAVPIERLYTELFAPALRRVGERWASGEISVAEEHVASALVEQLMGELYPQLFTAPRASLERVLIAAPEEERHVIGLRMVADILEGHGFEAVFLGGDVPRGELPGAARRYAPRLVVMGAYQAETAGSLAETATAILAAASEVSVLAGGATEELRAALGERERVEIVATIEGALPAARRALGGAG